MTPIGEFGGRPIALTDCAHANFAVLLRDEVNTVYDPRSRILQLSALGRGGVDVVFFVDVDDPTCRSHPALAKQLRDAVRESP